MPCTWKDLIARFLEPFIPLSLRSGGAMFTFSPFTLWKIKDNACSNRTINFLEEMGYVKLLMWWWSMKCCPSWKGSNCLLLFLPAIRNHLGAGMCAVTLYVLCFSMIYVNINAAHLTSNYLLTICRGPPTECFIHHARAAVAELPAMEQVSFLMLAIYLFLSDAALWVSGACTACVHMCACTLFFYSNAVLNY